MKKRINGRIYDTDVAKIIGSITNGFPMSDFRYYYESLYLKRNGEYFIYSEGGPMSKAAEYYEESDSTGYGEHIKPISIEDAKKWIKNKEEGNLHLDDYEEWE